MLEAAFIEKENGSENWRDGARRAGALLEWLSHPKLNVEGLPLQFLAAAAYQLAGYPALSSGLLIEGVSDDQSRILYFLLKADFPSLFEQLAQYWSQHLISVEQNNLPWQEAEQLSARLQQQVIKETISALGILCTAMRWGERSRLPNAF